MKNFILLLLSLISLSCSSDETYEKPKKEIKEYRVFVHIQETFPGIPFKFYENGENTFSKSLYYGNGRTVNIKIDNKETIEIKLDFNISPQTFTLIEYKLTRHFTNGTSELVEKSVNKGCEDTTFFNTRYYQEGGNNLRSSYITRYLEW